METSLIGKAVGFGSKEYGFDSRVSNMMRYNTNAYVINHVNLLISNKKGSIKIVLNRRTYRLVSLLHKVGCISHFVVTKKKNKNIQKKYLVLSSLFYRNTSFFKTIRIVSTPSRRHTISLKALKILSHSLSASVLLLSTPKGLMDHHEAINCSTGGLVVAIIS